MPSKKEIVEKMSESQRKRLIKAEDKYLTAQKKYHENPTSETRSDMFIAELDMAEECGNILEEIYKEEPRI